MASIEIPAPPCALAEGHEIAFTIIVGEHKRDIVVRRNTDGFKFTWSDSQGAVVLMAEYTEALDYGIAQLLCLPSAITEAG